MMKSVIFGCALATALVCGSALPAGAEGLRIAPLIYDDVALQKNEVKKGFVDIANPEDQPVNVTLQVKAFRQIDDSGGLEFYFDKDVAQGVRLDLETIRLEARGAMRVYFLLDAATLPQGDVFATVMASTSPAQETGTAQSVAVGTLLIIHNGQLAAHRADVSSFTIPWLQIGDQLRGHITLTNPADPQQTNGFFPSVRVAAQPYGTTTIRGPLLQAGRSRSLEYSQVGSYFGPLYIQADAGGVTQGQLVFAVTGYWLWAAPLLGVIVVVAWLWCRRGGWRIRPRAGHVKALRRKQ